jgi:poly-gamma-glutamate capsule biosynthesis protein CapA/YwtB (metallophosphatase superfamily)
MNRRTFLKTVSQTAALAAASRYLPQPAEGAPGRLTLALVGDCIINRRISELRDPDFLAVVELLRGTDCVWGNCEIVLADPDEVYPISKGVDPHALGEPWAADELAWMGIRFVGTANNHTMDFGSEGLASTLRNLERVGIRYAGAGANLEQAAQPAYFDGPTGRVGQVNCASTFLPSFAAGPDHPTLLGRPGLNPLHIQEILQVEPKLFDELKKVQARLVDLLGWAEFGDFLKDLESRMPKDTSLFYETTIKSGRETDLLMTADPADVTRITEAVQVARNGARIVITSIHSHESRHKLELNAPFLQPFARACIDAGADVFVSTGPHVLRGIEIYKGKPIFYSLSNFLFQYETEQPIPPEALAGMGMDPRTADPWQYHKKIPYHRDKRFWRTVVPRLTYEGDSLATVELHPVSLGFGEIQYARGVPVLARGEAGREILDEVARLSQPFGTAIEIQDGIGRIRLG